MKKYFLVQDNIKILFGRTLYRIRYLRECGWSSVDSLGGYVESEDNFSQDDQSWLGENACVFDGGRVEGMSKVYGRVWVYNNSIVMGRASVFDYATVKMSSLVTDDARVFGSYVVQNEVVNGTQKRVRYVN